VATSVARMPTASLLSCRDSRRYRLPCSSDSPSGSRWPQRRCRPLAAPRAERQPLVQVSSLRLGVALAAITRTDAVSWSWCPASDRIGLHVTGPATSAFAKYFPAGAPRPLRESTRRCPVGYRPRSVRKLPQDGPRLNTCHRDPVLSHSVATSGGVSGGVGRSFANRLNACSGEPIVTHSWTRARSRAASRTDNGAERVRDDHASPVQCLATTLVR